MYLRLYNFDVSLSHHYDIFKTFLMILGVFQILLLVLSSALNVIQDCFGVYAMCIISFWSVHVS
jgi:hypothetical protein